MVSDRAFIFHIFIPLGNAYQERGHLSKSNFKVTFFKKQNTKNPLAITFVW